MITNKQANTQLKSIISEFRDGYDQICRSSREAYLKTLAPGATVPKEGLIHTTAGHEEFKAMAQKLREKADAIMEEALSSLREKMTAAPSTEAVNTLSVLNLRDDVTEDEIDSLLAKFSDSPQAWQSVLSIAKRAGFRDFLNHPVFDQLRKVEDLQKSLDSALTASSAMTGRATNGFLALLEMQVDDTFSTEL